MNDIYLNEWSLFFNFFIPSSKIISKERNGSKMMKKHDQPRTPFQRLYESNDIAKNIKDDLRKKHKLLNPFLLQNDITRKIKALLRLV